MSLIRRLFAQATINRLTRFFLVGATAAGIQTALLWLFVGPLGLWYLIAAPIVIEITIILQYGINNAWTFAATSHTELSGYLRGLCKTNIVRGSAIPIQTGLLYAFAEWGGLMYLVANLGAIFISGFYRYALDSRWTWDV